MRSAVEEDKGQEFSSQKSESRMRFIEIRPANSIPRFLTTASDGRHPVMVGRNKRSVSGVRVVAFICLKRF